MKEDSLIEEESFTTDKGEAFRDLVFYYLKKISEISSVEWVTGYWDIKFDNGGDNSMPYLHYNHDTTAIYMNSIEFLSDILFGHFDQEMMDSYKEFESKLNLLTIEDKKPKVGFFDIIKGEIPMVDNNQLEIRKLYHILFRDICSFLKRINYLKKKEEVTN